MAAACRPRRTDAGPAAEDAGAAAPYERTGVERMNEMRVRQVRTLVAAAGLLVAAVTAAAQGRTDVVTLANGDHITGEVVRLDRGQLEFKTDDAGTIRFEWDKIASLVTNRQVELVMTDGGRLLGTLGTGANGTLTVTGPDGTVAVEMTRVAVMQAVGRSFWRQIDVSIDAGYSYTRSSGIGQLNVNANASRRRPAEVTRISLSLTQTRRDDEEGRRDDRGALDLSYGHFLWSRWFVVGMGRFESNESLGLTLRSQAAFAAGPSLVNTTRTQLMVGAGMAFNDERGVGVEPTQNVEGLFSVRMSYDTYDSPTTNVAASLDYYPSVSDPGRHRLQLDASVRREFWKDLYLATSVYNTFDSRPPNPEANTNDVGLVVSVGWSY